MLFAADPSSGHAMAFDDRVSNQGGSPVETILMALGACSAMDVVSIAAKKRQAVDSYRLHVRGTQRDEYPRSSPTSTSCTSSSGRDLSEAALRRSIELSATKYCPVNAMVSAGDTVVHHRYRIRSTARPHTRPRTRSSRPDRTPGPNLPISRGSAVDDRFRGKRRVGATGPAAGPDPGHERRAPTSAGSTAGSRGSSRSPRGPSGAGRPRGRDPADRRGAEGEGDQRQDQRRCCRGSGRSAADIRARARPSAGLRTFAICAPRTTP